MTGMGSDGLPRTGGGRAPPPPVLADAPMALGGGRKSRGPFAPLDFFDATDLTARPIMVGTAIAAHASTIMSSVRRQLRGLPFAIA